MLKLFRDGADLGPGVAAEYNSYGSPDVLLPRILTGEADIAALPANLAANLYNRKVPYKMAAVIGGGVLYLVSSDRTMISLDSFRGKELNNIAKGSTPEFILRHLLESAGLAGDVKVTYRYNQIELSQTLIAGRESSGVLPEPFATKVLLANSKMKIVVDFQKEWARLHPEHPVYPMSVLVVKESLLKGRPDIVKNFLRAYRESQEWVKSFPAEAGETAEKLGFGITKADAEGAIPRCNLMYIAAAEARPLMESFLSIFLRFAPESIGRALPDEGFYTLP
jgi:NitT/TauT family transport system substrate-binding protein